MQKGPLYLILASLFFSLQPVFVKLASGEISGFLMLSLRLFGMLFVFLPLAFHFKKKVKEEMREWKKFVVPALLVFGAMGFFTIGIYFTENATLTGLLVKTNSIFIPLMAAALFVEERDVLLSKRFLVGAMLAGIGVVGVITGGEPVTFTFGIGVGLILLSQISWSSYSMSIKRFIRKKNRLTVLAFIFPLAFLYSLPFALYEMSFNAVSLNPWYFLIPVVSGVTVAAANVFQFKAIQSKGLIVTNAFGLTAPLLTGIIAFFLFGELLSGIQILFGSLLILGAFLIIRCKCDIRAVD